MATTEDREPWDFYPCRVDDAPASIFVNLRYDGEDAPADRSELYWVEVELLDAGAHGMGSASEAEALYPLEAELAARARADGLVYVGRLRNAGKWTYAFYGAPGRLDGLSEHARQTLGATAAGGRAVEVGTQPDPMWDHYRGFLLPDAERRQWMQDAKVVDALKEEGDPLVVARRVDHWAYFATAEARRGFVEAAAREGFAVEDGDGEDAADGAGTGDGERAFDAQIWRTDPVELAHIHGVVMRLVALAEQHAGSYDGWETEVQDATPEGAKSP